MNQKRELLERITVLSLEGIIFLETIGFGLDYLNTDKLSLFVFPYLQYGFLGVSKSASLNRNFLSIGISTGIRF